MGYLIDGYKIMGQELKAKAYKHRAGIGTAVSIGGTIVSNILSTKAGAKSARDIDAKEAEIGRKLTVPEKVKLCWKNHIGSAATAAASCAGAGYSQNENVKEINKIGLAYSGIKQLYDSGRQATKEILGEKKNAELQDKLNQKYIEEHPEVKKKIVETGPNPDPSTKQKYFEPVFGEVIFGTRDQIIGVIKAMNAEMRALPARNQHVAGRNGIYGVPFRKFYEYGGFNLSDEKMSSKMLHDIGFNKGKESNGSDDDIIDAYFTPMLINNDQEACICINWEQDPSDMAYGDRCKF